jgi:hypothetical protein
MTIDPMSRDADDRRARFIAHYVPVEWCTVGRDGAYSINSAYKIERRGAQFVLRDGERRIASLPTRDHAMEVANLHDRFGSMKAVRAHLRERRAEARAAARAERAAARCIPPRSARNTNTERS